MYPEGHQQTEAQKIGFHKSPDETNCKDIYDPGSEFKMEMSLFVVLFLCSNSSIINWIVLLHL